MALVIDVGSRVFHVFPYRSEACLASGWHSTVGAEGSPFGCDSSRPHIHRLVLADSQPPGAARIRSPAVARQHRVAGQQHRHLLCGTGPATAPAFPANATLSAPPPRSAAPTTAPTPADPMGTPMPATLLVMQSRQTPCRSRHGTSCRTASNCSEATRASCHDAPRRRPAGVWAALGLHWQFHCCQRLSPFAPCLHGVLELRALRLRSAIQPRQPTAESLVRHWARFGRS